MALLQDKRTRAAPAHNDRMRRLEENIVKVPRIQQPAIAGLPRWLIGLDALVAIAFGAFVTVWALRMPSPWGPVIAFAAALCFPAAVLLGALNGAALGTRTLAPETPHGRR